MAPDAPGSAAEVPDSQAARRRRVLILVICSSSLFMTYLDSTILNVALPTLQRELHASVAGLQWVADAYLLILASLLLLTGSMADRIGRRRVFVTGLLAFSAGSLLCSLAPDTGFLIGFRMLQALGGSMLTPVSLSIVRNTFTDPVERARAIGVWSGIFGLATACGPIAGGVLVSALGWRSVFWLNVPIGIIVVLAARRYVPESRAPRPRRLDVPGQILIIAILGTVTYAVIEGPDDGWSSPAIIALFAFAAAALAVFVVVEQRRREPLLELRFFRSRPFTGATVVALLSFTVLSGFLFVNTLYLQEVRGDSALTAGIALLSATAAIAVSAPVAGRVVARRGPRLPLIASGILIAAGGVVLMGLAPSTPYPELALAYVLLGLGLGTVNPPITNTAVTGMPPQQAGVASAVASTSRQVGNVLGVAVMGAMLTAALHAGLSRRLLALRVSAPERARLLNAGTAAGRSSTLPAGIRDAVRTAVSQALTSATHGPWALVTACGLLIVVTALLTTTSRAQAAARVVAGEPLPTASPG